MKKAPGTSGLMPVKGSGCGIRPNIEEMEDSEGFDFSAASELLQEDEQEDQASVEKDDSQSEARMKPGSKLD
ncbi:MAG: hypothetical protein VYE76_03595 [Pseudomonadota bacterium]|nr:hypothetical protein [Pseudomonadota bacterium]|tara:strand:- start:420 stop:635 length:216 start_codon:yes stop_codon:yes gene_type:complete